MTIISREVVSGVRLSVYAGYIDMLYHVNGIKINYIH